MNIFHKANILCLFSFAFLSPSKANPAILLTSGPHRIWNPKTNIPLAFPSIYYNISSIFIIPSFNSSLYEYST